MDRGFFHDLYVVAITDPMKFDHDPPGGGVRFWRRRWEVRERAAAAVQRLQLGAYLQVTLRLVSFRDL